MDWKERGDSHEVIVVEKRCSLVSEGEAIQIGPSL